MGNYAKGILGSFNGLIGTVVGSKWRGIEYMRSRPGKRTGAPSQKQLEQEARFKTIIPFFAPFSGLLSTTFGSYANGQTGYNAAVSYNMPNIITGTYPDFTLDYSKAVFSLGKLDSVGDAKATAVAGGKINFTWTDNSGEDIKATDTVIMVIYNSDSKRGLYTLNSGILRSAAASTKTVSQYAGKMVETWLAFLSADGKSVSDSVYAGEVTVLA